MNPSNLPEYSGPTGTIEGTVWVDGEPPARRTEKVPSPGCPGAAVMYATTFREGMENEQKVHALADAPVGVVDPAPPSTFYLPPHGATETLKLTGCLPEKRTLAMTFGQSLDVLNKSGTIVAPQLQPSSASALMVATVNGDPVHLYPQRPGHFRLTDMLGKAALDLDVYVFLFSLHDVTTEQGRFHIEGVPLGKRRVFAHLPATDAVAMKHLKQMMQGALYSIFLGQVSAYGV